jgi:hypothetical protein
MSLIYSSILLEFLFLLQSISLSLIYLLNIFIYLLTPLGGVLSYYSLLRMAFDAIFGALLFLQCLFSLHMFIFMLP